MITRKLSVFGAFVFVWVGFLGWLLFGLGAGNALISAVVSYQPSTSMLECVFWYLDLIILIVLGGPFVVVGPPLVLWTLLQEWGVQCLFVCIGAFFVAVFLQEGPLSFGYIWVIVAGVGACACVWLIRD